jgi:Spy/CpxP family protein refolding chaperone
MTNRTRTLSAIALAAVVLGVGIATVSGQGRGPGGPFPILRHLNLTDQQKQQVKALTEELRKETDQAPARKVGELRRQLQAAIFADSPDAAQIDQLRASIADAEAAALAARIDLQLKIAQILTPEQRKQARDAAANLRARRVFNFLNFEGRRRGPRASHGAQE